MEAAFNPDSNSRPQMQEQFEEMNLPKAQDVNDGTPLSARANYPKPQSYIIPESSSIQPPVETPLSSFPSHDRSGVMLALKGLQDKIRKLDIERRVAEGNLKSLATETMKYRDLMCQDKATHSTEQSAVSKNTQELETQLNSAENRCQLLEKQLDYMRKMVQNAEQEKQEAVERHNVKDQLKQYSSSQERKVQLEKIAHLEHDLIRLSATQDMAQNKISELEEKLKEEKLERKILQGKSAELAAQSEVNRRLIENMSPPAGQKSAVNNAVKKPAKKKCCTEKPQLKKQHQQQQHVRARSVSRDSQQHFRLNMAEIPFVTGKSTGASHNIGANLQQVISLLKNHSPYLCGHKQVENLRRSSWSSGQSSESDLGDLLLQLQDEFAQMGFEHAELMRQIDESSGIMKHDLEREMETLVQRMEAKDNQITRLKQHRDKVKGKPKKRKVKKTKNVVKRTALTERLLDANGEVEVTTTIKTKGRPVHSAITPRNNQLKLLKDVKKLQTALRKDDISWDC
ncbi:centrosomal protein of 57 kDa-like isoform X2 [Tubulanus polymorphus]|uniref:centrosomal protein of 57 kDa-like isoform X2 n=1 Tax=Tubulanus polymorphus TaxID=672921 RepID=UPI003DA521E8